MTFLSFTPGSPDWFADARCRGAADLDLFFPVKSGGGETATKLRKVRALWCGQCPVVAQCLTYALEHREEGFWGGTSTAQRDLIRRRRSRLKCPGCRAETPVLLADTHPDGTVNPQQVCRACGLSWKAAAQ